MKYKNFNTQPQIKSFVLFVKSDGHAASLTVHVRLLKKCVDALDVSPAKENHQIYLTSRELSLVQIVNIIWRCFCN